MTKSTVNNIDARAIPFNACLGADIEGVDLSNLDDAGFAFLSDALETHHVVRLRGQKLSDPDLITFASWFGDLDPPGPSPYGRPIHPTHPELNVVTNLKDEGGIPLGNLSNGEAVWHADITCRVKPPKASALYALEVPPEGGDTYFADMFAAYAALDDGLKQRIAALHAIHDEAHNSIGMLRHGFEEVTDVRDTPGARHPLVRRHPVTGAKCLFLGRRPYSYIVGLDLDESEELLDALWAHATQPQFTCSVQWRVGDLVLWDNLSVLHRRDSFDDTYRRLMHRAQIKGTEAIA